MKTNYNFFVKSILVIASVLIASIAYSQGWEIYYDSPPNVANCTPGVLKNSEKMIILDTVNYLRSLHGLKPVTYNYAQDPMAQAATLMMVANNDISHTPPTSWQCYTPLGAEGANMNNLFLYRSSSLNNVPTSVFSIQNWIIDDGIDNLGHRLAIINPFLSRFAFGRTDGSPKVQSQYTYASSMTFKWGDNLDQNLTDWNEEIVALPYHNYPTWYFQKTWRLSFSIIIDKSNWGNNFNKVNFGNKEIEMKDESQQSVSVYGQYVDSQEGWGGMPNCLSWFASGLLENKKYYVTIKNVNVNGTSKNYTYWFVLNTTLTAKPDDPVLYLPENNATGITVNPTLQWNPAQRAFKYRLMVSKNQNFISDIVVDDTSITNYSYSIASLEPFTTYYWKVEASNDGGKSAWSPVWSFTTAGAAPAVPTQVFPGAGDSVSVTPKLLWNTVLYAEKYNLQISPYNDYFELVLDVKGLIDTAYTVNPGVLNHKRNYFWRVQAENGIGKSSWSSKRFKTVDSSTYVIEIQAGKSASQLSVYPNPLDGNANIIFHIQSTGNVMLKVYSSLGIEIITLVDSRLDAGNYMTEFNGSLVSAGTYYIKLISVSGIETGKMTVIK